LTADNSLRYSAETDKFYKPTVTTNDYTTSRDNAVTTLLNGINGQLVTIRSADEQQFIESITENEYYYLGGTDTAVEGEWRWNDGTSEADLFFGPFYYRVGRRRCA